MSGIVRSDLNSLAEAFDQAALRFRTARLQHATINGINPASRHGCPSEKARALLACAPTRGRHPIDYATVQVGREGVEPFGLSVFFSPTDAGALAFEDFQTLAGQAYRKAAALSGSDVPHWTFPAPEHEQLPHLWAIGLERWAPAAKDLSGIVCAEDVAVHPDGNTLSIGKGGGITLGSRSSGLAEEVAYIARNVARIVWLEDDLFSASASAIRWLIQQVQLAAGGPTREARAVLALETHPNAGTIAVPAHTLAKLEAAVAALPEAVARITPDTSTLPVDPHARRGRPTAQRGMTAEQARLSAEAIVKRDGWPVHRGKPSKRRLADKVGCSPSTLNKAIEDSAKLRRALAVAGDPAGGAGQNDDLSRLLAEQELDDKSRHA